VPHDGWWLGGRVAFLHDFVCRHAGIDRALTLSAAVGLGLFLATTVWLWPQLPDVVPVHFGLNGRPDAWGERGLLLLLPVFGIGTYALLSAVLRMPVAIYNFPWPVTPQNRERQLVLARRLVLAFREYAVLLFLVLFLGAAFVALGKAQGLGWWFFPVTLGFPAVILASYFMATLRVR
jgi:hypothetical protein